MKMKNVTPADFVCVGGGCPAVFETDRDTYLIVGIRIAPDEYALSEKIAPHETMVEIPVGLIREIVIR